MTAFDCCHSHGHPSETVDTTARARSSLETVFAALLSPPQEMKPSSSELLRPFRSLQRPGAQPPPSPAQPTAQKPFFPLGALYSGFIFRGSANKFLPNCPQTKKVHISALKVTGGITDQVWHICRPPPAILTICSPGHPLHSPGSPAPNTVHLSSPLLS